MDLDSSDKWDFTFAYDVKEFSDRLLRIEIWDGVPKTKLEDEVSIILISKRKKRKIKDTKKENALDVHSKEQNVNCSLPSIQNSNVFVGFDEDEEMEESMQTNDEDSFESNSNASSIIHVKTIQINSSILAAKCVLFSELFANETKGSERTNVTIRIHVSEEVDLMHVLRFMYSNTISKNTSAYGLMTVLKAADKYKVASCMKYCSKLLQTYGMSPRSAVTYLNLAYTVRMVEAVQPLIDAAKQYLTSYFNNFDNYTQPELMKLHLLGIEVVLSNNDLQIPNEDTIYEFLIEWVALHYSEPDKRRNIMNTRLSRLMRFHYMSCKTLKNVLNCPYFDSSVSSKLVLDALFFQAESPHNQRALIAAGDFSIKRPYKQFPYKIVEFNLSSPRCIVYMDLKMEECIHISTFRYGCFQCFDLNRIGFCLNIRYMLAPQSGHHFFGMILGLRHRPVESKPIKVQYKFSAMLKPSEEFILRHRGNFTFVRGTTFRCRDLFAMPWTDFMSEDGAYFINGSLHLMVELMIIN